MKTKQAVHMEVSVACYPAGVVEYRVQLPDREDVIKFTSAESLESWLRQYAAWWNAMPEGWYYEDPAAATT